MDKQTLQETVSQILDEMRERPIPLGVSSRHIHLSTADYLRLFPEQPISEKKLLMQPGQFAAEQVVTLEGPKGKLHNVRLLGPLRNASQVEISRTDARTLGYHRPATHVRRSQRHSRDSFDKPICGTGDHIWRHCRTTAYSYVSAGCPDLWRYAWR